MYIKYKVGYIKSQQTSNTNPHRIRSEIYNILYYNYVRNYCFNLFLLRNNSIGDWSTTKPESRGGKQIPDLHAGLRGIGRIS